MLCIPKHSTEQTNDECKGKPHMVPLFKEILKSSGKFLCVFISEEFSGAFNIVKLVCHVTVVF